ncbi:MAG: hypothetical protein KatS3mg027_1437 [Bacteroidia bacterium]|nr:MAG: hypothetical protein KatS3mg027_1437 [Bacteroidia bacterium]
MIQNKLYLPQKMKKTKVLFWFGVFILFSLTLMINSCKNKLNILAPYKELVSVYAILNPQEQYQFIRINKVFAGEGNAYDMAQNKDSINFPAGQLQVSLKRKVNGSYAPVVVSSSIMELFLRDTVIYTQSGTFNKEQRYYYTNQKIYPSGTYELYIKDTKTNVTFTASTTMIDSVKPGFTQPLAPPYYPVPPNPNNPPYYYLDLSNLTIERDVRFNSEPGAYMYELYIQMHYIDSMIDKSIVPKIAVNRYTPIFSNTLNGGETLKFTYTSNQLLNSFYLYILNNDNDPNILFRRIVKFDYIIYAANYDYYVFLQSNIPSSSVAQDKPIYSNISNGAVGIFAARSRIHVSKHPSNSFISFLATTKPFCNLRFLNYDGTPSSTCN